MKLELMGGKLLSPEEYRALGFKCGLEIHQQLNTEKKLFCHCPVGLVYTKPDANILRHMRPTLSELGEYDGTALMEFKTKKEVIYQLFRENTCTYEMDDTPPFPVNQQAIDIAIEIALLFNCSVVDEVHIVRKQYLDGSIPTGFQRTAVIGLDGWVPYKDRKIRIMMLTLEEDACREVSDIGHTITFTTDRLSTPLVEVITCPDIESPYEVEEVNWLLAEVLRSSGKVRRGIGTVREDVNVSIEGGTRVEIKGVPKIGYHAALTHNEAMRQKHLLEVKKMLGKKGMAKREDFKFRRADVTDKADWKRFIPTLPDSSYRVMATVGKGIDEALNYQMQPGTDVATEIGGRVRVVACLDKMPNIIHSRAEMGNFIPVEVWARLNKDLKTDKDDTVILVWGSERDTNTALNETEDRIVELAKGVPNETRQSLDNGVTDFERILPGPDRMYPDTDSTPTRITAERIQNIKHNLPPNPFIIREFCDKNKIPENITNHMLKKGLGSLFYSVAKKSPLKPLSVAIFIVEKLPQLRREGCSVNSNGYGWVNDLLCIGGVNDNAPLSIYVAAARMFLSGKAKTPSEAFKTLTDKKPNEEKIFSEIKKIAGSDEISLIKDNNKKTRAIIRQLKDKFGDIRGSKKITEKIQELTNS
jgi:glutamyl-tRNA(Gln) amidotransferase subunit E